MYTLANDPSKNIVLFINDYYPEYDQAFHKLAERLGRPLRGILLIDKTLKEAGQNLPDPTGKYEEMVCDFKSDSELCATVKQFEEHLLLVTCSAESSQMDFQRVLPHVPYTLGPSERSLEWATHKGKMRELIGAYDSSLVPKVQPVANASDTEVAKVLDALTFPMMVKPTGLSDSSLVAKVQNEDELRRTLHDSFAALEDTYKRNRGNGEPGIIVEEFMEGQQFTIDGYINDKGQIWLLPLVTGKSAYQMGLVGFYTYQTETYHELTSEEDAAGKQAAEHAIHAIGLRSSVAHMDMLKTASGWKIVEIGARPGAMRQEIYEASYGVDHALNEFLIKIGFEPEMGNGLRTHSMVFKVYPDAAGEVVVIDGIDEARRHPSSYTVQQFTHPGDMVLPTVQGGSVAVQGILCGTDVTQLRREVAEVQASIKIRTRQPDEADAPSTNNKQPQHVN